MPATAMYTTNHKTSRANTRVTTRTYRTPGAFTKAHKGIDPDPMMSRIVDIIIKSGKSKAFISERSGVSQSTIGNWMSGKTKRPQRQTVDFVLKTIGYRTVIIGPDGEIIEND